MSDVGHCQGDSSVQGWFWTLYLMIDTTLLISPKNQLDLLSAKFMPQQEKTAHSFDAALSLLTGESAAQKALLHSWCTE